MKLAQIQALAGRSAFERGTAYHEQSRMKLSKQSESGFEATAQGTHRYRLWLRKKGPAIEFACTCPAAADGSFCKHLVAATLSWTERESGNLSGSTEADLQTSLLNQPRELLAEWLYQAAMADDRLERQLRLKLSNNPAELKKALSALLRTGGFLDWRRSQDYALRLDAPLEILESLLNRAPDQCLELTDYTINRLLRVYERVDDSSGMIGDRLREFTELHARAAAQASVTGARLAANLFKFKRGEDWNLFPLKRYWERLGAKGQAAYLRLVEKALLALPEPKGKQDYSGQIEASRVLAWREEIARCEGDFDTLIDLLSRDLNSSYDFEKIVKACREFGHDGLALNWAERGLKQHPDARGMRPLLAEEYQHAGLDQEARDLLWQDFRQRPSTQTWQRLQDASLEHWITIRRQALDEIAEREHLLDDGRHDVSLRIELLLAESAPGEASDPALKEALDVALEHAASPFVLQRLAKASTPEHPQAAASLYRRAADAELPKANANTYRK
ncbi:MAG: DUF6880 family protein, partial [Pseudomonadota bacterium]